MSLLFPQSDPRRLFCIFISVLCVQTWGSVQEASSSPQVQSFLSSVNQFISNLGSVRVHMERKFQLQQVQLPAVMEQLSSPADYTAAGRTVDRLSHPQRFIITEYFLLLIHVFIDRQEAGVTCCLHGLLVL